MSQAIDKRWPTTKLLTVVALVAVIGGALVGAGVAYGFHYEAPTTREFYIFTSGLDFNESTAWPGIGQIPHDTFTPDHITVNKGDKVIIHYVNTEDPADAEDHNFHIGAPYNVDVTVPAGETANMNFTASWAGIFAYKCEIHQPIMTGYMTVLG